MRDDGIQAAVGIDVSKDKFDACCFCRDNKELFRLTAPMDISGFESLVKAIETHAPDRGSMVIGMESTGCYHMNLFAYLTNKNYLTLIINPLLIKNFMKIDLRKTKTDRKDAAGIARFLLEHQDAVHQLIMSEEISDLRDLARQREGLNGQVRAIKNDFKRLLSVTFPELEKITNVFSRSVLQMLSRYPSARAIRSASVKEIDKSLREGASGRTPSLTGEQCKEAAKRSVGTSSKGKEFIVTQKAAMLLYMEEKLQEMTETLTEMCESLLVEDMEIMTSLRGVGKTTAAEFLGEIGGDISKFSSAKKLIAFAGLDPEVRESGQYKGQSKLSKRGITYLRAVIWQMAVKVIRYNELFQDYFQRRRQEGLPFKKAVLATAHKLIRVVFSMLKHRAPFSSPL